MNFENISLDSFVMESDLDTQESITSPYFECMGEAGESRRQRDKLKDIQKIKRDRSESMRRRADRQNSSNEVKVPEAKKFYNKLLHKWTTKNK